MAINMVFDEGKIYELENGTIIKVIKRGSHWVRFARSVFDTDEWITDVYTVGLLRFEEIIKGAIA